MPDPLGSLSGFMIWVFMWGGLFWGAFVGLPLLWRAAFG